MQPVNLVRLFIASPSDVAPERDAALDVIHEWNAAFSMNQRAAIEAVRMETHAQATLGGHPQELLNKQLLGRCDLLVAIFWSRLGSPTPTAPSGTVSEILEFSRIRGRENVLLFFCNRDYPHDIDVRELERVREFREAIRFECLFIPFGSTDDFRALLRQQLDMRMQAFAVPQGVLTSHGLPMVALESDGAGTRIDDFRSLRAEAKRSMYVMGIGMTLFSADVTLMRSTMAKGLSVRLLMMHPSVVAFSRSRRGRRDAPDVSIMEGEFGSYFARGGYGLDLGSSFARLTEMVHEAKKLPGSGSVELRTHKHFIPLNFTAVDEFHAGKVLIEFCLPFSDQRLRMLLTKEREGELFSRVMANCEALWTMADRVAAAKVKAKE